MNKLFAHNTLLKENLLFLVGVCLCLYFSYHALLGQRSLVKLYTVESKIETLSKKNDNAADEKQKLLKKVTMMRPGSVDKDLLEEQVRLTLGYRSDQEYVIISN